MRRLLAAALLLAAASAAAADDALAKAVEDAVARGDNRLAARLVLDAMRRDPSDAEGARSLAFELRRRVRDVDLPAEQQLLSGLAEIDVENATSIRKDLARSYRHGGLVGDAREEYAKLAAADLADTGSRYWLAVLDEELGDVDKALAVYDGLIAGTKPGERPEYDAHYSKTKLLIEVVHDLPAARRALDEAVAAAGAAPPSPERAKWLDHFGRLRADLDQQETRRTDLREMRGHLNAALVWIVFGWAALVGGGVAYLRRRALV